MKITFLGTNGWFCTETGETVCTLLETKDHYILLDSGNGVRRAKELIKPDKPVLMFLSHLHLDHIVGLHFLEPLKAKRVVIFTQKGTRKDLETLFNHPFMRPYSELPFPVEIKELEEGTHKVPFPVTCKPLVHADPVFGFRFELEGKTIAYCTDTGVCDNFKELARGVDLLVSGCAKLPESEIIPDWPHMNPQSAANLAKEVGAKRLILTHFEAAIYTLNKRKEAERTARKIFPNTTAARDGLQVEV